MLVYIQKERNMDILYELKQNYVLIIKTKINY